MKIAIVTHNVLKGDGQGRVNYELARYLAEQGEEVHLFANRIDGDLAALPRIVAHRIPALRATNLVKGITFALVALPRCRAGRYDVVHNNGDALFSPTTVNTCHYCHSAAPFLPGARAGLRPRYLYKRTYRAFHAWMERRVYRRSGAVIAVSGLVAGELARRAGVDGRHVVVIHNGVDVTEFQPRAEPDQDPARAAPLRALFAGDLNSRRKGLDTALRALRTLESGVLLSVVGDHARSPYTRVVESDERLRDVVRFTGFRTDMPHVYREHQVLIFPSQYDPFGLVVLEAMATGLAVIVSARAGAAEVVRHGHNGFVLDDPRDAHALARYLAALRDDPALRRRVGANARATALEHSWQRMARQVHDLYRRLLTQHPAHGEAARSTCVC